MPLWTGTIEVTTDASGGFRLDTERWLPPLLFKPEIAVDAHLRTPGVAAVGEADMDARDGAPSNPRFPFRLTETAGHVPMGRFRIDNGGETFRLSLAGRTEPPRPFTRLEVELRVS